MATFSSKQKKRQSWDEPIWVLASIALIGLLVAFSPLHNSMYSSIRSALVTRTGAAENISLDAGTSFASDLQYWNAQCSHGWTSDSTCDALVSRTKLCALDVGSAYCSGYNAYLQQIRNQRNRISY